MNGCLTETKTGKKCAGKYIENIISNNNAEQTILTEQWSKMVRSIYFLIHLIECAWQLTVDFGGALVFEGIYIDSEVH